MTGFLIDTNIISEVLRPKPDERVTSWTKAVPKETLFLSVVSFGEIKKGLTIMPTGARRSRLATSIEELIPAWFAGRILPMTQSIAERWGVLGGATPAFRSSPSCSGRADCSNRS